MHSNTKQAPKKARGGKKRRTANNNNNDDEDDDEKNERTTFCERFWEVPLTLEKNINLTKDSCLVPAEQITLRVFDEPSQIDPTFDEVCLFFLVFAFLIRIKLLLCCFCYQ